MKSTAPAPSPILEASRPAPASGRELLWVGLALAVGLIGLTLASGSVLLIVRDFWLDEICTWLLTTDPSLTHALAALSHGVDSNPPALYLILRGLHALGMPLNETSLRLFAGASAVMGLLGCYALLRRVFDRVTSGAAMAALLAGDLLIRNLYEARFYEPWFAICAWFCFSLAMHQSESRRARAVSAVAVAVLTPLLLLIHYFGLFTLLLIVPADFLAEARPLGARLRSRWPLLTGLPALAVVAYFYLHQRAAFTRYSSWIDPSTWSSSFLFLRSTFFLWMFLTLGATLTAAWLLRKRLPVWRGERLPDLRPLAGLLSLALLPLVVLLFSILVQPAGMVRYALPGMGGVVVLAALGLWRLRPLGAMLLAGGWIIAGGLVMHNFAQDMKNRAADLNSWQRVIAAAPTDEQVVCERRHELYPLVVYAPQLQGRLFLLDFDDGEDADAVLAPSPALAHFERDAARVVARSYPAFALISRPALPRGKAFIFISADSNGARLKARFHGGTVTQLAGRAFEVTME